MSGAIYGGSPPRGASRQGAPGAGYNPVVTSDGVRWRDYELAAESSAEEWRPVLRPLTVNDRPVSAWHDGPAPVRHDVPVPVRHDAPAPVRHDVPVPARCDGPPERRESSAPRRRDGLLPRWPEGLLSARRDGPSRRHDGLLPRWPLPAADWFDAPGRPPRLDASRPYGTPGGLAWPDPQVQRDLCQVVPDGARFPDPRGTWVRLVNGEGPSEDPFRATNSLDCALAVVSTWHGEPVVAAPRQPGYDRVGRPSLSGEAGGVARAERWLGHRFEHVGQGRRAYTTVARRLGGGGHGAAAVLVTRWPSGGSHAWNAVNAAGEVVWIDAQRGHTSVDPPPGPVTGVFCVVIDRRGRRL
ncbi:toxin glutamine deamidase domain-containing protein [Sphaerisporangium sp. NPDC049002]|uniref:toxin glutamine deamidase domain-containing protein n=1 Tax=unclassified Sphaerisporangium TaxID=2630420 RepID=UPI0033C9FC16